MAVTNKFKVFAESSNNLFTDDEYVAEASRTAGNVAGEIISSKLMNTAEKTASLISVALVDALAELNPSQTLTLGLSTSLSDLKTSFKTLLQGVLVNAATRATNVANIINNDSTASAVVSFTIGDKSFSKTVNNVANASTAGSASIASTVSTSASGANTAFRVYFSTNNAANASLGYDSSFTYNPSTHTLALTNLSALSAELSVLTISSALTFGTYSELKASTAGKITVTNVSTPTNSFTLHSSKSGANTYDLENMPYAVAAGNVTTSINGHAISSIFETNGTTVKKATTASSANSATNVTSRINNKDISAIFESNGTTVKNATNATTTTNSANVTTSINGKAISTIFESDGTTVKNATAASRAVGATNADIAASTQYDTIYGPSILQPSGSEIVLFERTNMSKSVLLSNYGIVVSDSLPYNQIGAWTPRLSICTLLSKSGSSISTATFTFSPVIVPEEINQTNTSLTATYYSSTHLKLALTLTKTGSDAFSIKLSITQASVLSNVLWRIQQLV